VAFNINKYSEITRDAFVDYGENGKLNFVYYPNRYTPNFEKELASAKDETAGSYLKAMMLPILKSWDVVEETPVTDIDGKPVLNEDGTPKMTQVPVPLTEEGVGNIPLEVMGDIVKAMAAAMKPGESTPTVSSGSLS